MWENKLLRLGRKRDRLGAQNDRCFLNTFIAACLLKDVAMPFDFQHPARPTVSRRTAVQAGSLGLLGLGIEHLAALRADTPSTPRALSVIYIFLSGGLAQQESFDPKPMAPLEVRGDFKAISTRTPGISISEHLPMLADRSDAWALCRSLTHHSNDHSAGHHIMLCGRSDLPIGFDPALPKDSNWPSMSAMANALVPPRNNLPPAIVLPEKLVHRTGRVLPGQFAGLLGRGRDPWFLDASPFNSVNYGAYPEYLFHHHNGSAVQDDLKFRSLNVSVPQSLMQGRLQDRLALRDQIDRQRLSLEQSAEQQSFDRYRQMATSLLVDQSVAGAFDISRADQKLQERYGKNSFGWSLLMASRLVEAGVSLVQVNLGNNETWDTHESAWTNLREYLLPPMDRAVSALLDDLSEKGLLDRTLIVMAGEFGRTPKISTLPGASEAGRDHWGAVQSVFFAGGGVRGGTVIGSSDKIAGEPATDPQKPENLAATLYEALGLSPSTTWHDSSGRPFQLYEGRPISGLMA